MVHCTQKFSQLGPGRRIYCQCIVGASDGWKNSCLHLASHSVIEKSHFLPLVWASLMVSPGVGIFSAILCALRVNSLESGPPKTAEPHNCEVDFEKECGVHSCPQICWIRAAAAATRPPINQRGNRFTCVVIG